MCRLNCRTTPSSFYKFCTINLFSSFYYHTMPISIRNPCLLLLLAFCCILCCSNAHDTKQQQQQMPSAMVVGTVYCDTCFRQQFSKASHFISGASVSVECASFRKEVKTNRHGVFRVRLPPKVSRHVDAIKACSVNLIRSSEPFCAVASSATSTGLHLKSKRNGLHVFSAGLFTYKPLKQPDLCYQEPKPVGSLKSDSLADQKQEQPAFIFPPPIPFLPSPGLPLPPNPLVPPPSLLPPIIPSPPPSLVPPIFPSPPPSLLPPLLPPVPFLTPPPPPPASIFPPFPIPFPPNPLFPGNPPAPRPAETSP